MSLRRKLLTGSAVLLAGQVASQAISFIRNVLVADIVGPDDFGIAATFVIAVTLLNMISNISADRLLVQADDGDDPAFQATAHSFQLIRGAIMALALAALAWPMAWLYGIPEITWAFFLIALIPLVKSFTHLDVKRLHRQYRYGKDVLSELAPQLLSLGVLLIASFYVTDFRLMLILLFTQAFGTLLATHAVSERPFRLGMDRAMAGRLLQFGWPLMLNGGVLFALSQGDRVIVGANYTMAELGAYSAAAMITMALLTMFAKMGSNLALPLLSSVKNDRACFLERYQLTLAIYAFISASLAAGFLWNGTWIIGLLFDADYQLTQVLIGPLAIACGLRLIKAHLISTTFAFADSKIPLAANMAVGLSLPLALAAGISNAGIIWVVYAVIVGDACAVLVALVLMQRRHGIPVVLAVAPLTIFAATALFSFWVGHESGLGVTARVIAFAGTELAMGAAFLSISVLRAALQRQFKKLAQGMRASGLSGEQNAPPESPAHGRGRG